MKHLYHVGYAKKLHFGVFLRDLITIHFAWTIFVRNGEIKYIPGGSGAYVICFHQLAQAKNDTLGTRSVPLRDGFPSHKARGAINVYIMASSFTFDLNNIS